MRMLTALTLTNILLANSWSWSQETVQDWSNKVVELQEKEGQNFDQDLILAKGYIYLQRRSDALSLLVKLIKSGNKKDQRLMELLETASDQFFHQETAESYADLVQFLKSESWSEAQEKLEAGLQKEVKHRLLTFRAIQLGIILGNQELKNENGKVAELFYSDSVQTKIYRAWMEHEKKNESEVFKLLNPMWINEPKTFEQSEMLVLSYLECLEQLKRPTDWMKLSKMIQKHPEWVFVRVWRLKNKNYSPAERKNEISLLKTTFNDLKKLKSIREKFDQEQSYFYFGILPVEKAKLEFEELMKQGNT